MDNKKHTTLEVVRDDQGSAAWKECGPGGCTTSRQRLPRDGGYSIQVKALERMAQIEQEAAATFADFLAAIGLAATALRWTLPIRWESKRRKRRARGRQREAKREGRVQLGAGWGLELTEVASGVEKLRKAMKSASPWEASDDDCPHAPYVQPQRHHVAG